MANTPTVAILHGTDARTHIFHIVQQAALITCIIAEAEKADHITLVLNETHAKFKSDDYKTRIFKATNGVTLYSRNSPAIISSTELFLNGAYDEFDHKPLYLKVPPGEGLKTVYAIEKAIDELSLAIKWDDHQENPARGTRDFRDVEPAEQPE